MKKINGEPVLTPRRHVHCEYLLEARSILGCTSSLLHHRVHANGHARRCAGRSKHRLELSSAALPADPRSGATFVQEKLRNRLYGGPVLTKPKLYLIFWGWRAAGDPNAVKPLLLHYAKSIGGSGYNDIYTQYYGPSGNIKNPRNQYGAAWFDDSNAIPAQPTDKQVAAEALRFIKPDLDTDCQRRVRRSDGLRSITSTNGFGTKWCAYHSATTDDSSLVPYINLPYVPDAGGNCGANYSSVLRRTRVARTRACRSF